MTIARKLAVPLIGSQNSKASLLTNAIRHVTIIRAACFQFTKLESATCLRRGIPLRLHQENLLHNNATSQKMWFNPRQLLEFAQIPKLIEAFRQQSVLQELMNNASVMKHHQALTMSTTEDVKQRLSREKLVKHGIPRVHILIQGR